MYEIVFDPDTLDQLEKLDRSIAERIFRKIISTKEEPHHYFSKLTGRNDYKLRVGQYRVIADIDDNNERIEVTLIDHRKKVYK